MRKCPKCRKVYDSTWKVCMNCGIELLDDPSIPETHTEVREHQENDAIKLYLKGLLGQLEVYQDKVIIKRKGAIANMGHGFTGDKTIYINQITSIQLKLGSPFLSGYIQFTIAGVIESNKGLFPATRDKNAIIFRARDNKLATEIREFIEEQMMKNKLNGTHPTISSADELRKYKQLLDEKIISQEEFEQKKKQLLGL